jgi:hypothetical protein
VLLQEGQRTCPEASGNQLTLLSQITQTIVTLLGMRSTVPESGPSLVRKRVIIAE